MDRIRRRRRNDGICTNIGKELNKSSINIEFYVILCYYKLESYIIRQKDIVWVLEVYKFGGKPNETKY